MCTAGSGSSCSARSAHDLVRHPTPAVDRDDACMLDLDPGPRARAGGCKRTWACRDSGRSSARRPAAARLARLAFVLFTLTHAPTDRPHSPTPSSPHPQAHTHRHRVQRMNQDRESIADEPRRDGHLTSRITSKLAVAALRRGMHSAVTTFSVAARAATSDLDLCLHTSCALPTANSLAQLTAAMPRSPLPAPTYKLAAPTTVGSSASAPDPP